MWSRSSLVGQWRQTLIAVSIGLACLLLLEFNNYRNEQQDNRLITDLMGISELHANISNELIHLRNLENLYYISRGAAEFERFNVRLLQLQALLDEHELSQLHNVLHEQEQQLMALLQSYRDKVAEVDVMHRTYGQTPEAGVYGEARALAHQMEEILIDRPLLLSMLLQMRRFEKDYQLRSEATYMRKLTQGQGVLVAAIENSDITPEQKQILKTQLQGYVKHWQNLAQIDAMLLDSKQQLGQLLGQINQLQGAVARNIYQWRDDVEQHLAQRASVYSLLELATVILVVCYLLWLQWLNGRSMRRLIDDVYQGFECISGERSDLSCRYQLPKGAVKELKVLGRVLNQFLEKMQKLLHQVIDLADELGSVTSSVQNMNVENVNHIRNQVSQAEAGSQEMRDLSGQLSEISVANQNISEELQQSSSCAGQAQEITGRLHNQTQGLAQQAQQTTEAMTGLANDVTRIGSVVEVIAGIAEQTNLLALNAAIEAARAGESGRGFAVVADEVRALAQRTNEATQEIRQQIETIQHSSERNVSEVEANLAQAKASCELTEQVADALQTITASLGNVMQKGKHIAEQSQQLKTLAVGVAESSEAMQKEIASTSLKSIQAMSDNGDLSQYVEHLRTMVRSFDKTLQEVVDSDLDDDSVELF